MHTVAQQRLEEWCLRMITDDSNLLLLEMLFGNRVGDNDNKKRDADEL